jgi:signal transduction histidine kinase
VLASSLVRSHSRLRAVGALTWGVVAVPILFRVAAEPRLLTGTRYACWSAAFVAFGLAFWLQPRAQKRGVATASALLGLQSVATLAMAALIPTAWSGAPLVVVADQLAALVMARSTTIWIAAQSAVLAAVFFVHWSAGTAIAAAGAYLVFQLFAIHVSRVASAEAVARQELERANAELRATRDLLEVSSTAAERARISGELHDVLGHHLTALTLNLEAALHLEAVAARPHVEAARGLTKLLLADVRAVAGQLRAGERLDPAQALRELVVAVPSPSIAARIPDDLRLEDPACAHALVRAVQEILTNAMRHSAATRVWLDFAERAGGVAVSARDNGRGWGGSAEGLGLRGMRERLHALGGTYEIGRASEGGLRLELWVPGVAVRR